MEKKQKRIVNYTENITWHKLCFKNNHKRPAWGIYGDRSFSKIKIGRRII